jgi:hypothetical protein
VIADFTHRVLEQPIVARASRYRPGARQREQRRT